MFALPHREPPDSPGWTVRVVPNLYPAFERQLVVVHSPRHVRSFADLSDEELAYVAEAWARELAAANGYVHALVNEGAAAGASLAHSHSQLVLMPERPPAVTIEETAPCRVCELVTTELGAQERVIVNRDGLVALCPRAGRAPYELLIAATESGHHSVRDGIGSALALLAELIGRLRAVEGTVPWNAWLHNGAHWHIEVVPRLSTFAGIELGAGIYVNTLAPEEAAARLRAV